jgi:hypothetical protein
MENVLYFHQKNIQKISLDCRIYEELGYNYDIHEDYIELGKRLESDAGLVNIETLINKLIEMNSNGATHVACDFHCDHEELDLYAVEYRLATPEEIEAHNNKNKVKEEAKKQREIELLEEKLKALKGE